MARPNWPALIELIRHYTTAGSPLIPVHMLMDTPELVHLGLPIPASAIRPVCGDFDELGAESAEGPANCPVCLALAREASGAAADDRIAPRLPSDRCVWKLKAFNHAKQEWKTRRVGDEDILALALGEMLRWKLEGQEVRLEWSQLN